MALNKEQIIERISKQPIITQNIRRVKSKKGQVFWVVETKITKFFSDKYMQKVKDSPMFEKKAESKDEDTGDW